MKKAPIPKIEKERIKALNKYDLLDTGAEACFDEITALAKEICETDVSLISLVDTHRQWFKSKQGLDATETPRDISFCGHAIMDDSTLIVENALKDERFADNPLVKQNPEIRFYAGAPLITPEGYHIGTLCVIDGKPQKLNNLQKNSLKLLAKNVIQICELRLQLDQQSKREEELKIQRQFLTDTINNAPSLFYTRTHFGEILMTNENFESYFADESGFSQGKLDTEVFGPANIEILKPLDEKVLETGSVVESEDILFDRSGNKRIFNSYRFPYKNSNGDIYATGCISIDITNKKIMESQSLHKAKLASIGEMAAGAGHEINNPLAIIIGYVGKLKKLSENNSQKDEISEILEKINASAYRISNIVSGIRSFARYDSEGTVDFDIIESVKESTQMVREIYDGEGLTINFETEIPPNKIHVEGNRGQIQQVLINLISNARDATTQVGEPQIEVSCKFRDENILIQVADNGTGISPEIQARIFDPFFTTKAAEKGTGIGLSLVNKLVTDHNGTITVDSTIGEGTTFTISLPAKESAFQNNENLAIPGVEEFSSTGLPKRILLVDDEPEIRELLRENLVLFGYDVTTATNGNKALKICEEKKGYFDLVLCDVRMPEMDGYEFFQKLKKIKQDNPPKFAFITGGVNIDLAAPIADIEKKVDGFLYKPFNHEQLLSLLQKIFENEQKIDAA